MTDLKIDKQHSYTFVIQCENNKYYIGIYNTNIVLQPSEQEPIKNNIIKDEKILIYKPIKIISFVFNNHELSKNINYSVKQCMRNEGINNVRGDEFTDLELSKKIINKLNFEFLSKSGYCFHCMKTHNQHFKECVGKNIDTSAFLKDCNDYNTVVIKINYITNIYDKVCLLKYQINEISSINKTDAYKKYILNNNDPDNMSKIKDEIIIKYELDCVLFDKKIELVNIYKIHKSEYYLKDILIELYKKRFIHMDNSIQ